MASTYALPVNGSYYSHGDRQSHQSHSSTGSLRSETLPNARSNANAANANLNAGYTANYSDPHVHFHGQNGHIMANSPVDSSPRRHSHAPEPSPYSSSPMKAQKARTGSDSERSQGLTNGKVAYAMETVAEADVGRSTSWLSRQEAMTAVLAPLPFLFVDLMRPLVSSRAEAVHTQNFQEAVAAGKPQVAVTLGGHSLLQVPFITAGTLLAVALAGAIQSSDSILDRRKSSGASYKFGGKKSSSYTKSLTQAAARATAIALPIYASTRLGGARTALLLLTDLAAGLNVNKLVDGKAASFGDWTSLVMQRKLTYMALACSLLSDYSGYSQSLDGWSAFKGHLAVLLSLSVLPLPLPTAQKPATARPRSASNLVTASTPFPQSRDSTQSSGSTIVTSLIRTTDDIRLTFFSGIALLAFTGWCAFLTSTRMFASSTAFGSSVLCIASAASFILFSSQTSLQASKRKSGLALGYILTLIFALAFGVVQASVAFALGIISCLSFAAVIADGTKSTSARLHSHQHHGHRHAHHSHGHSHGGHSKFTGILLARCAPGSIVHSILSEKDSRRIAYFALLNLGFMMVQFFYGFVSGSLGLLTDSIHMLFDCAGLAVGLAAAVMSKWPADIKFPYGYGKVDTISGFANGIFLMLVSVEIVFDAIERLTEGHELRRLNELLVVSVLGFLVNLVGLTAFGHAHHGHGHDHDHSHDNENMQGIFLHIMADALGSVAVIISTLLTKYYGWSGWDPIASCIIAVLIFVSAIPLVKSSGMRLLLSLPADHEYGIRNTLQEITSIQGVVGYSVPRFWLEDSGAAHGHDHHDHDHSHGHGHEHANGEKCDRGAEKHSHGHDHELEHHAHHDAHSHSHDHSHGHSHSQAHSHAHSHSHNSHSHAHAHHHKDTHPHSHANHDHSQDHNHGHGHDHDHDHAHTPARLLGLIHIIAARTANFDDVRQRAEDFLRERNMDVVIHVERDGDTSCWCGGGSRANPLSPAPVS